MAKPDPAHKGRNETKLHKGNVAHARAHEARILPDGSVQTLCPRIVALQAPQVQGLGLSDADVTVSSGGSAPAMHWRPYPSALTENSDLVGQKHCQVAAEGQQTTMSIHPELKGGSTGMGIAAGEAGENVWPVMHASQHHDAHIQTAAPKLQSVHSGCLRFRVVGRTALKMTLYSPSQISIRPAKPSNIVNSQLPILSRPPTLKVRLSTLQPCWVGGSKSTKLTHPPRPGSLARNFHLDFPSHVSQEQVLSALPTFLGNVGSMNFRIYPGFFRVVSGSQGLALYGAGLG